MILIADSGSTKTSWCLTDGDNFTEYYSTGGLNPFFRSTEEIADEIRLNLMPKTGIISTKYIFTVQELSTRKKVILLKMH